MDYDKLINACNDLIDYIVDHGTTETEKHLDALNGIRTNIEIDQEDDEALFESVDAEMDQDNFENSVEI